MKMHELHQVDMGDYIKQSGRASFVQAGSALYGKMMIPDFRDDESKRLR